MIKGLKNLRWDDEDDDLPTENEEPTSPVDQSGSSCYLNMTSSKSMDVETIPLVGNRPTNHEHYTFNKPTVADGVIGSNDYLPHMIAV